jgi:hypothetical protein
VFISNCYTLFLYLWLLHPVAHLSNSFLMMPSIATKFQYVNSFLFSSFSLHVSAPTGHLQVRYTIGYFNGLFLIQRIRCTYVIETAVKKFDDPFIFDSQRNDKRIVHCFCVIQHLELFSSNMRYATWAGHVAL